MSPPCYATRPDRVLAHEFSPEKILIRLIVGATRLLIVKCHSGSPLSVAMIISITIVVIMITMMMSIIIVTNLIFNIIVISVSRPPPPA